APHARPERPPQAGRVTYAYGRAPSSQVHREVLMSASLVYSIVNFGVVPAWALLVFAPRWRGTWWVVHAITIPLLLTVVYVAGLVVGEMPEGASGATLEQMQRIFDAPWIAVSCWVHFIVG